MKNNGKKDSFPALQSLGRALGVSERTVSRLRADGMPGELKAANAWYRQRLRAKENGVERAKVQASLRYRRAQRQLAELELGRQRGDLIPIARVRQAVLQRELAVKDRLLAVPSRVANRLEGRSQAEMEAILVDAFAWALEPLNEPPLSHSL